MPGTCAICEERVVEETTPDGSYKGACAECRESYESPPSHVETCEQDACLVCLDYAEEFGT